MQNLLAYFPSANPIKMVRATNEVDLFFEQKIPFFETQKSYYQKYQLGDYIQFQVWVNVALINKYGIMVQLRSADDDRTWGIFQRVGDIFTDGTSNNMTFRLNLYNPAVPEGDYYVYMYLPNLSGGTFELFYSEPLSIKTTHEGTIKLRYTNEGNDFDMQFYENHNYITTRIFEYRVEGGFRSDGFAALSEDTSFIDQTYNGVLLSSIPYETNVLTFGSNSGIPSYQAAIINRIMSCTSWSVDGVETVKVDGAKLEPKKLASNHPLQYWQINTMPAINSYSKYHYQKLQKPIVGIGTMEIGNTFVISANTDDMTILATPVTNGAIKPSKPIPVPFIPAGQETEVYHNLGTPNVMWRFRDIAKGTPPQFSMEKKSDANPTTAITIYSEVDIPAGTMVLDVIGYYEY